jgi:hypothetical protein
LPEKALLLVANCTGHSGEELVSEDGQFTTTFLPPNTTALIQPMDQNPVNLTKLAYRKSLLSQIVSSDEEDLSKCLKEFSLKHAFFLLSNAWGSLKTQTIEKS